MHYSAQKVLTTCIQEGISIAEYFRGQEAENSGLSPEELDEKMLEVLAIMQASSEKALDTPTFSISGMTGSMAHMLWQNVDQPSFSGSFILQAMAKALSTSEVNASMGKIVAAPTAGAAGILPAALAAAKEKLGLDDATLLDGLYTAGAIGKIIALEATISGADGGCQAECGTAAAMAAGGISALMGATPEQSFTAASFALINIMGLVCDPIAGFVEFPCGLRNASGVVNAFISADLAMAGLTSLVPFDEVVDAMYKVGKALPESLKETALGGIAATPSAKALADKYL